MWAFPISLIALLSALFSVMLFRFKLVDVLTYGSITVPQGFIGGLLLLIRRKLRFESSGLSMAAVPGQGSTDSVGLRQGACFLFAFWLLAPMLIGQDQGNFVDAAFRVAQLRKDHATVHVAVPWDKPFTDAGLHAGASFLGSTYVRFDDVTVRLRSMGSRVVIELPTARGKHRYIRIPRAAVEVE